MKTFVRKPDTGGGIMFWTYVGIDMWICGDDNGRITIQDNLIDDGWEPSQDVFFLFEDL